MQSCKVLPSSEKVKVLDLMRKENTPHAEIAKIHGNNESSISDYEEAEKSMVVLLSHLELPK